MGNKVGPYTLTTEVIRGPGAEFAHGRNGAGAVHLLQMLRLRAPTDDEDRKAREEVERGFATLTANMIVEQPDLGIHAHGGADGADDERVLFWAVDPPAGIMLGADDAEVVFEPRELIAAGLHLVLTVGGLHAEDRVHPLLSESSLSLTDAGELLIVGVPLLPPRDWLAADFSPCRLAPEEAASEIPAPPGDLWRAGRALHELSARLTRPSAAVDSCVQMLARPEVSARVANVQDAAEWMEMALESMPGGPDEQEAMTVEDEVQTPSDPEALPLTSEAATQSIPPALAVESPATPVIFRASTGGAALGADLSEARTNQESFRPLEESNSDHAISSTQVQAAAWAAPVLPVGASPWSEVVSAREARTRKNSDFHGFAEELPGLNNAGGGPRPSWDPAASLPPGRARSDIDPELLTAVSGFNGRRIVTGIVALLLIFGFFLMVSRPEPEPIAALASLVAGPDDAFDLETEPPGALVIAASDGQVLSVAPIRFLVPSRTQEAVIVWAPGYDAQRLVLSGRGRVKVALPPVTPAQHCTLSPHAVGGAKLEPVGFDAPSMTDLRVQGAAVVRARIGEGVTGARIVRCPSLGGEDPSVDLPPAWAPATIRVTAPEGAVVELAGEPLGVIPASGRASGAFSELRLRLPDDRRGRWWVPTRSDIEVRLPEPKVAPARVATRVAPAGLANTPGRVPPRLAPARRRSAQVMLQEGSRHLMAGRVSRARSTLRECVRVHPGAADCHRVLATLYRQAQDVGGARTHFERYLQLRPDAPDAATIRQLLDQ